MAESDIIKIDDDRRIVYGWASVVTVDGETVIDKQGDMIDPEVLEDAATSFMLSARQAKAMHQGDGIGEVVHSLPLTKAIAKSLGITIEKEGWIIAMKIHDEDVWKQVKEGKFKAFSIGGKAITEEV